MPNVRKTMGATMVSLFASIMMMSVSFAASPFVGTWNVKDTGGTPFQIMLSEDGSAKATRASGMTGTWKEDGKTAVITWNTGWTSKITEEDGHFKKTAYRKGQSLDVAPVNSSDAEMAK